MRGVFFYTIGISFAGGIFLRSLFDIGIELIVGVVALSFVCAFLWRFRGNDSYTSPLFFVSLICISSAFGMFRLEYEEAGLAVVRTDTSVEQVVEGTIIRDPDVRERSVHLVVKEDNSERFLLVTTDAPIDFLYGDRITARGLVEKPSSFETDLGRTFNYPGYLKARNIHAVMWYADVERIGSGDGNIVLQTLFTLKHLFMDTIERVLPEPQAGLGEGLLLGVKRALGEDLETIFRRTGIIHIVVLSGYNVMLVAEAIMRLLSMFLSLRVRVVVGVAAISLFALIVGFSATVIRASVMAALVLVARATGRTYMVMRALMLAGVVMLFLNPYLLVFDPGFQLSFLATLGLILIAPLIEARLGLVPTTLQIREFVTATIATQIMVLPLLLYLIGEFSLVAVIVNVLVLPAVPIAMLLTFLTGIVHAIIPVLGLVLGFFAHIVLSYIVLIPSLFSKLTFAAMNVPSFPFAYVILGYALITLLIVKSRKREEHSTAPEEKEYIEDDLSDWTIEVKT